MTAAAGHSLRHSRLRLELGGRKGALSLSLRLTLICIAPLLLSSRQSHPWPSASDRFSPDKAIRGPQLRLSGPWACERDVFFFLTDRWIVERILCEEARRREKVFQEWAFRRARPGDGASLYIFILYILECYQLGVGRESEAYTVRAGAREEWLGSRWMAVLTVRHAPRTPRESRLSYRVALR